MQDCLKNQRFKDKQNLFERGNSQVEIMKVEIMKVISVTEICAVLLK